MQRLAEKGYIPLDKSWMMRIGVLDLTRGYNDSINFLSVRMDSLNEDLKSLYRASLQWKFDRPIIVGESATLLRFLKFAAWKLGMKKEFVIEGTLKNREICDNPDIINWNIPRLLTLDHGTSQWASASVIMGNRERVSDPPLKLQVTYDAVEYWENIRSKGSSWEARYDSTILKQATAYLGWLNTGNLTFTPLQSEDYCFSRAFGIMTPQEGEKRWPSLRNHESDRILEMEKVLSEKAITSKDHRVIQAVAMLRGPAVEILHPESVAKSWPRFWNFLRDSKQLASESLSQ